MTNISVHPMYYQGQVVYAMHYTLHTKHNRSITTTLVLYYNILLYLPE